MAVQISKVDVWVGELKDRPGGLGEKLAALAEAGANLEFVISRRAPERPGTGVVFLAPLRGAAQTRAAKKAGLSKATTLCSLRLEGPDRAGFGAKITQAIAEAGINMRGFSAAALGRRCVTYFAFDTDADAKKASQILKKAVVGK
jgi:hypothetical protein